MKRKRTLRRTSPIARQYLKLCNELELTLRRLQAFSKTVAELEGDSAELKIIKAINDETQKKLNSPEAGLTDEQKFYFGRVSK